MDCRVMGVGEGGGIPLLRIIVPEHQSLSLQAPVVSPEAASLRGGVSVTTEDIKPVKVTVSGPTVTFTGARRACPREGERRRGRG
ncbi:hypothetical protein EYF80_047840 [Liparis tanakae]|uniref:Uncharacterized protein n=1 Tax=Liparis tanakae TaxID=230148 RepID=A0A4Z2FL75_9TELE|nr:hypothetical protein EYF80_047840 [Liparis tanakae]